MKILRNIVFLTGFISFVIMMFESCYNGQEGREINFKNQLGTYVLDIHKTVLGNYIKDSTVYKNLNITFKADSTFYMNMKVPFMYDSIGTWEAGNMKEWNWLRFKNFKYNLSEGNPGSQFTRPYTTDSNVYFLINAATPQDGAAFIQEIYFRKIKE